MTRLYVSLLWFGLLVAAAARPVAGAGDPVETVAFSLDGRGGILVPVQVGDGAPLLFLLDTGSNRTTITDTVAARLQAPAVARTTVVSATGAVERTVVRLPAVAVGRVRKPGLLAVVDPAAQLRSLAGAVDGILGQDFLLDQTYTIDYRKRVLRWNTSSAELERGTVHLRTRRTEGRFLVELPQDRRAAPLWLVPDSGADTVVLFGDRDALPVRTDTLPGRLALAATGGQRSAQPILLRELRVGHATLRDLLAVHLPGAYQRDAPEGDGLLPLRLFAQVSFDAAAQSMAVRLR